MYSVYPSHAYPYGAARPAVAAADPLGIERPPSVTRKFVELLLYLTLTNSAFGTVTGLGTLRFASGGLILASGLLTLGIMLSQRERLPISIWFAWAMAIGANLSEFLRGQLPLVGHGVTGITHWLSQLLMICYLVRNEATQKRVILFVSCLFIVLMMWGGVMLGEGRLNLIGVGSGFRNPNRQAYIAGTFAIALLFWSLRSVKILRPILWGLAGVLVYYLVLTVSRGGIATFACGSAVLMAAILLGRGVRVGGIILVGVGLIAASQLAFLFADPISLLERRFQRQSIRTKVYSRATLYDLKQTVVFGKGAGYELREVGITAHNSFLHAHTCFGGITAWPFMLWLLVLAVRIARMLLATHFPPHVKLEVVALSGMALACMLLSNMGYLIISTVYAAAVVEKYTAPYSHRRIAKRKALSRQTALVPAAYSAGAQPVYR